MQPTRRHPEQAFVLRALFLAAQLALSVAMGTLFASSLSMGTQEVLLAALPSSQVCLAALWAALATSHPAPRWGGLAAVVAFWTYGTTPTHAFNQLLFGLMVWQAATIFLAAAVLHLAGVSHALVQLGVADETEAEASRDRRQFGLGRLLIAVGFLAALLAAARFVDYAALPLTAMILHGVASATVACVSWHAMLAGNPSWKRVAALVVGSSAGGAAAFRVFENELVYWLSGAGSWETSAPLSPLQPGLEFALYGAAQYALLAGLILASLWVFRLCGYRWRYGRPPASVPASSAAG